MNQNTDSSNCCMCVCPGAVLAATTCQRLFQRGRDGGELPIRKPGPSEQLLKSIYRQTNILLYQVRDDCQ